MASPAEPKKAELAAAEAELRAHMASWEYAFAMGSTQHGGRAHPVHARAHERTAALRSRCDGLRARIAEYEI